MREELERINEAINKEIEEGYERDIEWFVGCSKAFARHGLGASGGERAVSKWLPKLYSLLTAPNGLSRCDPNYRLAILKMVVDWVDGAGAEKMRKTCVAMREAFEEVAGLNEPTILNGVNKTGWDEDKKIYVVSDKDLIRMRKNKQEHVDNMYYLRLPVSKGEW